MRLDLLQLIRYGKFTDASVDLPKSEHDFHVIVGPNEAGKSTIRCAITELLFGMPRSSSMAFIHAQPDLRLGASISNASGSLAFHRTKGTKNPLRTVADDALSEDALTAYLGAADRQFFEQMYGLDHAQLVKGGQTILDSSKDVGQALFQSAAGIAGLGPIRDALEAEAGKLWAPRKSGDRAYYIAATKLEEAERELKDAVVRTKAWTDARAAVEAAETSFEAARKALGDLEATREKLARVRRLSPLVQTLRSKTAELTELGDVLDLPVDATYELSKGQSALAVATEVLQHRTNDFELRKLERDSIEFDATILSQQREIADIEALRHRVRDHVRDLDVQKREVERRLGEIRVSCSALGWPVDEGEVRAALPTPAALRAVERLLRDHGALEKAHANAAKAVTDKTREVDALEDELEATPEGVTSEGLRSALSDAQVLRNTAITQQALTTAREDASRDLADALAALGDWAKPLDELRAMNVPSDERLAGLRSACLRAESDLRGSQGRVEEAKAATSGTTLEVEQFSQSQRVVTAAEVGQARINRDQTWTSLKSGQLSLSAGAPTLDAAIGLADQLVDAQLGSATAAVELQALRHRLEREQGTLTRAQETLAQRQAEVERLAGTWATEATSLGLNGMRLEDVQAWLGRREAALAAAKLEAQKQDGLERERSAAGAALDNLTRELKAAGADAAVGSLPAACAAAEKLISEADSTKERRRSLKLRISQGKTTLANLQADSTAASNKLAQWDAAWATAIEKAGLDAAVTSREDAEGALDLATQVSDGLTKVTEIRAERIDTMTQDLVQFKERVRVVAAALGAPTISDEAIADASKRFGEQLETAHGAHQRWQDADRALTNANKLLADAQLSLDSARASLAPLLKLANVESAADALPLIERSDKKRAIQAAIDAARAALVADTDGLGIEAALTEVDATDLPTLPSQVTNLTQQLEEKREELTPLTEERLRAREAFSAISGSANAALAEARRQEALSALADASERYLKVAAASRLLRWAIDRYRDRKQGPMLARAGVIFSGLTLGRYKKLIVDYEKEPLSLAAQRATGEVVEVPGLSEGTRDQLYLALRLAALELRLEQATPLPFVADDLFINFDDARSRAGLQALRELSKQTQVIFLSHHDHLVPAVRDVFGSAVNVVELAS